MRHKHSCHHHQCKCIFNKKRKVRQQNICIINQMLLLLLLLVVDHLNKSCDHAVRQAVATWSLLFLVFIFSFKTQLLDVEFLLLLLLNRLS